MAYSPNDLLTPEQRAQQSAMQVAAGASAVVDPNLKAEAFVPKGTRSEIGTPMSMTVTAPAPTPAPSYTPPPLYGASGTFRPASDSMPTRSQYGSDAAYLSAYNAYQGGANPTVGQIYSSATGNSELDAAYDAQGNAIKATQEPIDENKIREQTLQRFQAEIDAINRFYAEKTARQQAGEKIVGEGRLGSGAAIQARRGMLGSDFGNAQTDKVTTFNDQQLRSIADLNNAEANSEIQAIRGQARAEAQQEIKDKQAAMAKGRQEYIDFLNGQKDRLDKRADTSVAALLASKTEATDTELEQIAKELGIDVKTLKDKYAIAKSGKAAEDTKNAPKPVVIDGVGYMLQDDGTYKAVTPAKQAEAEKPVIVGGVAYEKQSDGSYKAVTPTTPVSQDFKFVSATKYQPAGYFNEKTGEFRPVSGGSSPSSTPRTGTGGSTGSGSTGTGTGTTPIKLSPLAQSIVDGAIRFEDLTPTQKAKLAPELNSVGYRSAPKLSAGQQDDVATSETTLKLIDEVLANSNGNNLPGVGSLGRGTLGSLGTSILGLGTEEEKNVRSTIGNIRGTIAKLRGGASFTTGEMQMLNTYLPTINESPESVINKLNGLKKFLVEKNAAITKGASDRGIPNQSIADPNSLRQKYNY